MSRRSSYESCLLCSARPDLLLVYPARRSSSRVGARPRDPYIDLACFALLSNTSRRSSVLPQALVFLFEWRGVQAELQAEMPLWLGHEVAGQPHRTLVMWVSMLPP